MRMKGEAIEAMEGLADGNRQNVAPYAATLLRPLREEQIKYGKRDVAKANKKTEEVRAAIKAKQEQANQKPTLFNRVFGRVMPGAGTRKHKQHKSKRKRQKRKLHKSKRKRQRKHFSRK